MKRVWIWGLALFLLLALVVGLAVGLKSPDGSSKQTTTVGEGLGGETEKDWFE